MHPKLISFFTTILVPIVLHHSRKGWTSPPSFHDLLTIDPAYHEYAGGSSITITGRDLVEGGR